MHKNNLNMTTFYHICIDFCWHLNTNCSTDFAYTHAHTYMRNDTFSFKRKGEDLHGSTLIIRMKQCTYSSWVKKSSVDMMRKKECFKHWRLSTCSPLELPVITNSSYHALYFDSIKRILREAVRNKNI